MLFWATVFYTGYSTVIVQTNTQWNFQNPPPQGYEDGILIINGAELTISDITLEFKSNSRITVSDAKLFLNGATLTTQPNVNQWRGIEAFGLHNLEQFNVFPTLLQPGNTDDWSGILNPNQVLVKLQGATIEKAKYGVESIQGAIVQARNSFFIDCQEGVWIRPYLSQTNPNMNACFFMDSEFGWTSNPESRTDLRGIHLQNVRGVRIGGCVFFNDAPQKFCKEERGIGIFAEDAYFSAATSGNRICFQEGTQCPINCYGNSPGSGNFFQNLSVGIKVIGNVYNPKFEIRKSLFFFNLTQVEVYKASDFVIFDNTFSQHRANFFGIFDSDCEEITLDYHIRMLKIEESKNFNIYGNTFDYESTNPPIKPIKLTSIQLTNSSGVGEIKSNFINNGQIDIVATDNVFGIRCIGQNNLVGIFCNKFKNQGTDIKIDPNSTIGGFASDDESNGNKFSRTRLGRIRVDNSGNQPIEFYFYENDPDENPTNNSIPNLQIIILPIPNSYSKCSEDCPSPLGVNNHILLQIDIQIYPNPNFGKLFFKTDFNLETEINLKLEILNLEGQVIYNKLANHISELQGTSLEHLTNGNYLVYLSTNNFFIYKKLVIQK